MSKKNNALIRQMTKVIIDNIDDRFVDTDTGASILAENIVLKNIILSNDDKMRFTTNIEFISVVDDIKNNHYDYGIDNEVHILDSDKLYEDILKCVIAFNRNG